MREQICKMNPEKRGHDACGIGAVVDRWGRPSRQTVEDALEIVEHLEHRAGKDASGQTGDGVGILLQICHPFFVAAAKEVGLDLAQAAPRGYGVGMFFFPQDPLRRGRCQKLLEILAQREGVDLLGWRPVPVAPEILGQRARSCMPAIWQGFFRRPEEAAGDLDFDRRLYVLRRTFEQSVSDTYVASLSCRTIVYKGMFLVDQLRRFYPDLRDARYTSAIALVHSRFSTNTEPSWARVHPNRVLLHNGEINTIQGNLSRMLAREETMASPLLAAHREKVLPVLDPSGSDSAMLDNTLEFLLFHGLDLPKAVMVTLPEPWSRNGEMPRAIRDMYHYYATMMEPWDGPAALLFSDGDLVGACLDRNGLRPLRYYELSDGRVVLASEVGVLDLSPSQVVRKARLGPGQMLVVDTRTGTLAGDRCLKEAYAAQHPYGEWLDRELRTLDKLPVPNHRVARHDQATRDKLYTVFGYTYEDVVGSILPMAQQGEEPILSMGADVPIAALAQLFLRCDKACQGGANLLILSDRGVDENHVAIPSLLAVAALEQHLIQTRKRTAVSVILESGEPRDVHQVAALLGYGARAVNPYLAHECIAELIDKGLLDKDFYAAVADYDRAILAGVVSVAAKMGISSLQSYQSAQCFEAVGLDGDLMARFFPNTPCQVGGVGLDAIEAAVTASHDRAFDPMDLSTDPAIDSGGIQKLRSGPRDESHLYDPVTILTLQRAVRTGRYDLFKAYSARVDAWNRRHTLRGRMEFDTAGRVSLPLSEVEPVEEIVRRFKTGAMSYGSISQEAHECLAVAMNTLGGKSNSGEGGEVPERFGTVRNSAIKQVASGRFGVTSAYLVSAQEIQIKMAQGAKPGEGGHLPGSKAWPWIARTRCSTPGVSLTSPPPHHDIYSIEDLAELIYDLKNANRSADISVKLVSQAGVGTVAAGVAKAGAQTILISGGDGGTGAAPKNAIYHAGLPWEIGLAEAQRTLIQSGLRSRVKLEVDGKLMTGRDVAVACALGAEEFGFATAPLVALGCLMLRACNLDTCAAGIATQDPALRQGFQGKAEFVMAFMTYLAQEVREILAWLGLHSLEELVGRRDLLRVVETPGGPDVSPLLAPAQAPEESPTRFCPKDRYPFLLEDTLDHRLLLPLLEGKAPGVVDLTCRDRAFGTMLGSEVTRRFGDSLPEDTYRVACRGGAGQSFGAFLPAGVTLELQGDANDYFGKGLSGGKLIAYPPADSALTPGDQVIVGNVALYGATGGTAFLRGTAGERFCVRNSGALAVVEGVGDHGCEYMTGGRVAVIGPTGRNFAAGMSGGVVYVLDRDHDFYRRVNKDLVSVEPLEDPEDIQELREMLTQHLEATGSPRAREILERFEAYVGDFKKLIPWDYAAMTRAIAAGQAQGMEREAAELAAFLDLRKRGA